MYWSDRIHMTNGRKVSVTQSALEKKLASSSGPSSHLPALTGIRFFAIFHIFLHHLWAIFHYYSGKSEATQGLFMGLNDAPQSLMVFMSNGWVSTSLFFLLSGFILAYLYWDEEGQFTTSKRRFWVLRFARIYPIHLFVLAILIALKLPTYLNENQPTDLLISSAVGSAALVQAWVPQWIPVWSWPTWTISVMIFLYLIMPYLIGLLNRLSHRQQVTTLVAMPFVSILPTVVYAVITTSDPSWNMDRDLFFSDFPIFWVPYFVAGLLMTRVFSLNRFRAIERTPSWFAWGDLAFLMVLSIALMPDIEQPFLFFIRQGVLMPLYMLFILDLARGKGFMAKVFALPGTGFLGETGFSMFIWQPVVLAGAFISLLHFPAIAPYQVWLAITALMILAIPSTYLLEKPLARLVRKRYLD